MQRTGAGLSALFALLLAVLGLCACTTVRESSPQRTATEQLLISTAVDRAVERMDLEIPSGTKVYVDAEQLEGSDGKYAAAAIKERMLRSGANLADERGGADVIVQVRAGALSIDDRNTLVGIGSFDAPVPFAGQAFRIPEIALYREKERLGVAKIAAVGYRTADGKLVDFTEQQFGYSHENEWVFLFFFSWRSTDLPQEERPDLFDFVE
jgi:hypothetical protein